MKKEIKMNKHLLSTAAAVLILGLTTAAFAGTIVAEPGMKANMGLLPKFLGILVFDQAHQGAEEPHRELKTPGEWSVVDPTTEDSGAGRQSTCTTTENRGNN